MDSDKINLHNITYSSGYGSNLTVKVNGKKVVLKTPFLKSMNGIESDNGKYFIKLDLSTRADIVNFLKKIDSSNKTPKCLDFYNNGDSLKYIQSFYYDSSIWKVKLSSRYGRFQVKVEDLQGNALTINDITPQHKLECCIELKNIWCYNNAYGCIWNIKSIRVKE
jgi:hypothetical protein